jgi:hypothetical protein
VCTRSRKKSLILQRIGRQRLQGHSEADRRRILQSELKIDALTHRTFARKQPVWVIIGNCQVRQSNLNQVSIRSDVRTLAPYVGDRFAATFLRALFCITLPVQHMNIDGRTNVLRSG